MTNGSNIFRWLNAYNAPHWMTFNGINGWENNQANSPPSTAIENYGSSWMRDLMVAKGLVNVPGLTQGNASFRGATDANHGYTPFGHASHDLGMAMDLGISTHIGAAGQAPGRNVPSTAIEQVVAGAAPGAWSNNLAAEYIRQMVSTRGARQDLAFADFALLYAATIKGPNGSRDALATSIRGSAAADGTNTDPTKKTKILDALFGTGTQQTSLINGVIIGGKANANNTYPDIRYALNHLGFRTTAGTTPGTLPTLSNGGQHYNHFHIYFQAPERQDLPNMLLASGTSDISLPTTGYQTAQNSPKITPNIIRRIEKSSLAFCTEVENQSSPKRLNIRAGEFVDPMAGILGQLKYRYGIEPKGTITTIVTQHPMHGTLTVGDWSGPTDNAPLATYQYYEYVPKPGFIGKDKIGFEITINGKLFRSAYIINVLETWDNGDSCRKPGEDRGELPDSVHYTAELDSLDEVLPVQTGTPNLWLQTAQLSALLSTASQSLTDFTDLPGTAVGQTVGEGLSASITLDTNAAGHNWYIDPTPQDNTDDYLPTSNPNIWQAKAGTDAAGKMDMLSVLLHEYGHALGLEHSAQAGDFMSATLQPGQRRLPNADELALMSQLVAQIKASQADAAARSDALADPSAPAGPGNPLSMLGLMPLGFVRRNSAGNGAATRTIHTDYLTAIQPTLTNGSFATGLAQWESTGAVSAAGADAAHYTVTLSESSPTSAGQTHVGQAFVLGATDRFLSFTVSGLNLQSNSDAQDAAYTTAQDAFEVALLNANTGVSLLGGLGATHQQRTRQ